MSSRLMIKILQLIVILYVSYDIFKEPTKNIKVVEVRYQILHTYLLKQTKPYFELPPQMDPLKYKIPHETIAYTIGFLLGFFGILTLFTNSPTTARLLSIVVLSFVLFVHNPLMHEQSVKHLESKEGLLDLGIAGGFLVFANYYRNKKQEIEPSKEQNNKKSQKESQKNPQKIK